MNTKIYDISTWQEKLWFNTKGTREKMVVESPNGVDYYFKNSIQKEGKHYPFEFWSEIIASQLGEELKIPVLRYDVGIREDKIGCICASMITEGQTLIEGIQCLQAYDSTFDPDQMGHRKKYTFQFIEKALESSGLSLHMKDIINILIFDAIIGNQDRHQENWGFIVSYKETPSIFTPPPMDPKKKFSYTLNVIGVSSSYKSAVTREHRAHKDLINSADLKFAPIYDSGSSLGRELDEKKVERMLSGNSEFSSYINRGKSEVRWSNKHLSHRGLLNAIAT